MKVVGIVGSPRGMDGATGKLLRAMLDAAKEAGAAVETFSLADIEVRPCRACDVCHKTGTCAVGDGFESLKAAMLDADGIVLASPNYISSVTAQMKALFDRCCGPLHIQAFDGKYAAGVATGGAETQTVEQYMLGFLQHLGCWTVGSVGVLARQLADEIERDRAFNAAADLARTLVHAIDSKQTFPEQAQEHAAFAERMRQLVLSRKDEWTYEFEVWASRGAAE